MGPDKNMYQYKKTHKRLLLQPNLGLIEVHVRMTKKKRKPDTSFQSTSHFKYRVSVQQYSVFHFEGLLSSMVV